MARTVRTSLDIPEDLHRRIHEAARSRGCSARALILASIEREVASEAARGRVQAPPGSRPRRTRQPQPRRDL
jgi:hypothetical protein